MACYDQDGQSVYLPIKLDEGLLLLVLNSAARYGETVLADKVMRCRQKDYFFFALCCLEASE